jgi:hypothetical protein
MKLHVAQTKVLRRSTGPLISLLTALAPERCKRQANVGIFYSPQKSRSFLRFCGSPARWGVLFSLARPSHFTTGCAVV